MRFTSGFPATLALIMLLLLLFGERTHAAAPVVSAVEEIAMTVADADRSLAFFRDVLGCEPESDARVAGREYEALLGVFGARVRVVKCWLGAERLAMMEFLDPRGRPLPPDQRSQDGGFQHLAIVVRDMDAGYRWLRAHKVRHVSTSPQTLPAWNRAAAGIRAFYFADPDGHTLEIIWFPPGKGDPRWQEASTPRGSGPSPHRLFLGIDHTAIGVLDTEGSLRLYRDHFGLRVAGASENYGTEQEHLNNVRGARLRITTLRPMQGPGIELLEYLSPRDGRPVPPDLGANDVLHWQITLAVRNVRRALEDAIGGGARQISSGVVVLPPGPFGRARGTLVRDSDGHALLLRE